MEKKIYGNDTLFLKKGNKYVPYGVIADKNTMADGIWFVKHREYSQSIINLPYMASMFHMDAPSIDIGVIAGLEETVGNIMESPEFKELINGSKGYSINDIVHLCVAQIYKQQNNNNSNGSK